MIDKLPISVKKKTELMSLKTIGAGYGLEITQPSKEATKAFDNQIVNVIGGQEKEDVGKPHVPYCGPVTTSSSRQSPLTRC